MSWPGAVWIYATGGTGTGTFTYYAGNPVAQTTPFTFTAYANNIYGSNVQISQTINILPPTVTLTIAPTGIIGGDSTQYAVGTLQMGKPLRSTTAWQPALSPSCCVAYASRFNIQAGQTTGTFTVSGYAVTSPQSVMVTITYGVTVSGYVTVLPKHSDLGSCPKHCETMAGSPVNVVNGNVWVQQKDYTLPGVGGGLQLARTWNSLWPSSQPPASLGTFGLGWWSNYEERLAPTGPTTLAYWRGDGNFWYFGAGSSPGGYVLVSPPDERDSRQEFRRRRTSARRRCSRRRTR